MDMPKPYFNRFDPRKNFEMHLFRAGYAVQSAEFNEIQSALLHRMSTMGDALFKDGDILRDARLIVDEHTGATRCEAGLIYLRGAVREVKAAEFVLPVTETVVVGVFLRQSVVTELEDPSLRDPANGTRNYQEAGAARLKVDAAWGYVGDGQEGEFFPVYTVENGHLQIKEPPPQLDSVSQALARYDRDASGGSYVVNGFMLSPAPDLEDGRQVYFLSEGRARVDGFGVEMPTSRRLLFDAKPDLRLIDSEPHQSKGVAKQRITTDRSPIAEIKQVRITAEKTVQITHGGYAGAADPLPDSAIISILEVKQGGETFEANRDFKLSAGRLDWSLSGAEPAVGSSYSVKYQYIKNADILEPDAQGFSVEGAVEGSLILVSYTFKMPRIDRLCVDKEGKFTWISGVASDWHISPPQIPPQLLPLASVTQTWTESRQVLNDGVRVVSMSELADIGARLDALDEKIAQQFLAADANGREAGLKKGLFVDPFLNDDLRDAGTEQSAAIMNGDLTLSVKAQAHNLTDGMSQAQSLPFTPRTVLEQPLRTGSMKVNPYSAFDPLPAVVKLTPALDRWTETRTQWASSETQRMTQGWGNRSRTDTTTETRLLNTSRQAAEFLRRIAVHYRLSGFGANERLIGITFDGVDIHPVNAIANERGEVSGSFTIPEGIPAGSKSVDFYGAAGSKGSAVFVGVGELQMETRQQITRITETRWQVDPLAQTFTLNQDLQLGGVDLWFTVGSQKPVLVQIRETNLGIPTRNVLAEKRLFPADIFLNKQATRVLFDMPIALQANTEYALVVLTDDAEVSLSVASLGAFDPNLQRWVSAQAYQIGVLLSSSNASTWTPHQDKDLAFRLLKAEFSQTVLEVEVGRTNLENVTDLMLKALHDSHASSARVEYLLQLPDASTMAVSPDMPLRFAQALTGEFVVKASLLGDEHHAPILFPDAQLIAGTVTNDATYISRAIPAGDNSRIRVIFLADIPAGASVTVEACGIDAEDQFFSIPYQSSKPSDHGLVELVYEADNVSERMIKVRLNLKGTSAARPRVRDLRVMVI